MNSLPPFARAIKEHRDRQGMSRAQLAEKSELSYPYISQLETGLRKPSRNASRAIASALGISIQDLERTIPGNLNDAAELQEAEEFTDRLLTSGSSGQPMRMADVPVAGSAVSAGSAVDIIGDMIDLLEEFPADQRLDVLADVQKLAMRRMIEQERLDLS